MSECQNIAINGGCGLKCPMFERGDCPHVDVDTFTWDQIQAEHGDDAVSIAEQYEVLKPLIPSGSEE